RTPARPVEPLIKAGIPMTIVCITHPPVKPTRHAPRPDRPFGEGILPARRPRFVPSAEDMQWAAETSPFANEHYDVVASGPSDAELDFDAGCALAQARMDAGYSLF